MSRPSLAPTSSLAPTLMSALTADQPGGAVTIHDPSRLEWAVTLPFPEVGSLHYSMKAELEIPTRLYVEHRPWSHLQALARLDWPLGNRHSTLAEVDVLRREVLDVDGKLVRACEGFRRHCLAVSHEGVGPPELDDTTLSVWLDMGLAAVAASRRRILGAHDEDEGSLVSRERALADEFLSVRALTLFTAMTRHLDELLPSFPGERIASDLRRAYDRELVYRASRDFCAVDPRSPDSLEAYVARASSLKKHFESLLYLQRQTKHIDARMQPWIAAFAALFAGAGFFLVQLVAMGSQSAGLGSGAVLVAIAVGLLYAGRDRFKAITEHWLSTGLRRITAERITRLLSPLEAHHVVARAKESFEERGLTKADALNPELGGVDQATLLSFVHRGDLHAFSKTSSLRPRALRLLFRYDISPLFVRLDDPMKSVAVADPKADRLRLVTASRTYRIKVRLRLKSGTTNDEQRYDLVLDKRGLLRLELQA